MAIENSHDKRTEPAFDARANGEVPHLHYLERELRNFVASDSQIFDFLQTSTLDGLWFWDLENPEHEWMNADFWKLLGYDPAEKKHLASEWQDIINPEDLNVAFDNFKRHCEDPTHPYDQIVRYTHKKGHIVWVRCRGFALRNAQGEAIRMLGAHTDVTQLVMARDERVRLAIEKDAAMAANDAKSHFLASMSHELRTPLNAILGFAQIIEQEYFGVHTSPKYKDYAEDIRNAGKHLLGIIGDLLDLAKVEAAGIQPTFETLPLQDIVNECVVMIRAVTRKNLEIISMEAPDQPILAEVDRQLIRQICLNLLNNADKFSSDNDPIIVKLKRVGPDEASIVVEDTGIGISETEVENIFEPFKQGSSLITKCNQGAGLGLAISKEFATLHNGRLELESTEGIGTRVTLFLPLRQTSEPKISVYDSQAKVGMAAEG